jgi:HD superfamily phosphohydrolase
MESVVIDVLRTPELQRLRRIRQLGLVHLVFPGAEHSRLTHSLGAAWLAVRFGRQLIDAARNFLIQTLAPNSISVRDLAVAALCHDLGHGPLSHAFEREVIGEPFPFEAWVSKLGIASDEQTELRGAKWHEIVTAGFLGWAEGQLHQLLEADESHFSDRIRWMLRGKYYLPYFPRLLSSDIDVDRLDFVRRDTHQTGVAYGRYDLDWLISTCTVGKTDSGDLVVGFDGRKSIRVIEQFLIARAALYDTVYHHKTVRSAEGMVGLFLKRLKGIAREGSPLPATGLAEPYVRLLSGEALGCRELLRLDDFSLSVLIETAATAQGADETVSDLGRRILSRDLFKLVPVDSRRAGEYLRKPDAYPRLHAAIQPFCRGRAEYYLVVDETKMSTLSNAPEEMAYVVDENRRASPIRDLDIFREHWKPHEGLRMYTLAEAVGAVTRLIEQ